MSKYTINICRVDTKENYWFTIMHREILLEDFWERWISIPSTSHIWDTFTCMELTAITGKILDCTEEIETFDQELLK